MKKSLTGVFVAGLFGVSSGFFAYSAKADVPDILSEVATTIANERIGTRFAPAHSRRCFVAVQALIDGDILSAPEELSGFLEQVCYQGMRSELERQGILSLFEGMGIQPQRSFFDNVSDEQNLIDSAVRPCWNIGVLSTAAQNVSLRVSFKLDGFGRYVQGSIKLVEAAGGDEATTQQAFDAARRAIIRCEGDGYPNALSAGEYEFNFPLAP